MRLADYVAALLAHGQDRRAGVLLGIVGEAAGTWGAVLIRHRGSLQMACTVGPVDAPVLARVVQHVERIAVEQATRVAGCTVAPMRRDREIIGLVVTDGSSSNASAAASGLIDILAGILSLEPAPASTVLRGAPDSTRRAAIRDALRECRGNVSKAAVRLGMARRTLYSQMERLGIAPDR